ncbi:MAG: hypothetical protein HGB29_01380 [Chlorobiaceae bacterium]|nr:hypothetical protein [Chlorobiaceae bacterium]
MTGVVVVLMLLIQALRADAATSDGIRTQRIKPVEGPTTIIKGALRGYESVSYLIGARSGQRLKITLKSSNAANYFNLYAPGKGPGDEAMHIGELSDNHFEGTLAESGDYAVSLFLMRSAARRNETARYTLEITLVAGTPLAQPTASEPSRVVSPVKPAAIHHLYYANKSFTIGSERCIVPDAAHFGE